MSHTFSFLSKQGRLLLGVAAMVFAVVHPVWAQQVLAPTNFSSQAVGSSSGAQTLTFTGLPTQVSVTEASGTDFVGVPTCNGSGTCTVAVTFTPKYPGLREDAILMINQVAPNIGQVVAIGAVYGIGTGPQIATGPGLISTFANRSTSALSSATFNGVVMGPGARVYISDTATNSVYYVDPASKAVTRFAGNGTAGYFGDGGMATSAELNAPSALAFDASANLYIADTGNNVIREVTATGVITTVAGNGTVGFSGDGGAATGAQLDGPRGIAVDAQANVYFADTQNNRVRKITALNGQITTSSTIGTVAGNGTAGFSGDGGLATSAALSSPWALALDANGNLFIADVNNAVIREVSGSNISTVAGTGTVGGYSGDGGAATSAHLNGPNGIALDASGSLYISDTNNQVIRKVTGDASHTISTYAGTGTVSGYAGDAGPATSARFNGPTYLTVDGTGNVFVVDSGNFAVREITATAAPLSFSNAGPLTVTVSNTGNQALALSGISVSGSNFSEAAGGTCSSSGSLAAGASCTILISFSPSASGTAPAGSLVITSNSLNQSGSTAPAISLNQSSGLHFIAMTPCRAVDTRVSDGFSSTYLTAGSTRSYVLPSTPNCTGIPSNALAYSLNVTVVPRTHVLSFLTLWPNGQTQPLVSILNSGDGRIKANAAIVPADTTGAISVFTTDDTELVLDVDGYFVSSTASNYNSGLVFYPITPCRVADTRNANGSFGGPSLGGKSSRDFPISSSSCTVNVANAQSYVLNVTTIPKSGTLTYLTAWPTGQPQPTASVLNAPTGTVMANAAIIPAGTPNGSVSVYVSDPADVVIDISGYFASPGSSGLSLYTVTPCRALDTRTGTGLFVGAITPNIGGSACAPPAVAQAYVFNATVVPQAPLAYLTLWQAGTTQPLQSTLNADDATTMSNLAFVLNTNGSVAAYASNSTNLILDIFGYWAP